MATSVCAAAPAEGLDRWVRRARPLLGTLVEVSIRAGSAAEATRLGDLAFAQVAAHHAAMSFHEATSDVRAIAAARAGATIEVDPATASVLRSALALEAESEGVFNVAIAGALVARGQLPDPRAPDGVRAPGDTAAPHAPHPLLARSARAALRVHPSLNEVQIVAPVWIDLGGIAKGAAVDAALAALRAAGARAAVVNAGGDLASFGAAEQHVRVPIPGRRGLVEVGRMRDCAIATSAPSAAEDTRARLLRSSVVVPAGHEGHAVWAGRSVSVIASSCRIADALTKVLAMRGPAAAALLARHGARGFSIDAEGRLEHAA